jgi:hypothetical protein
VEGFRVGVRRKEGDLGDIKDGRVLPSSLPQHAGTRSVQSIPFPFETRGDDARSQRKGVAGLCARKPNPVTGSSTYCVILTVYVEEMITAKFLICSWCRSHVSSCYLFSLLSCGDC